ncbi:superfamily I DNA and/or RNA helicase [Chitinophaga skermanii]|uniref:Superfamily I DNA and/or RNA helicase n=1 Tax=Chitinophaga skermanii TaxID=331697 RepID=A0A327QND3_9BACT|nr:AAA domain-containing protein [Chitinophaga skermanii]RAJ05162.1 superfamily I DNA and/or RNA helicase [Chitinophaga skermanii]
MDYFKKLQELLKIEQEEDKKQYEELSRNASTNERRANGLTWYPIAIKDTEIGRGDYITVEVERTTHQDIVHQLRPGVSAALFSNFDPKVDRVEGTITWQSGNRLKLALRSDELPDWARDGKLGIDLLFDDNSYDEMNAALKQAITASEKTTTNHLVQVLTGEKAPTFHDSLAVPSFPMLNESQEAAVQKILRANEVAVVHGPPGTGKTTTLVQAIKAMVQQEGGKILVVAPSNAAVDLLSERLATAGLNVLRVGNPAKVTERLMSLTLDAKITTHASMKEIKALKRQASEFRDMAHKYKRNFGFSEREQRKALFAEARKIMQSVEQTEQYIVDDLVSKAQVITATLVGSNHYTVRNQQYKAVVIDEAGQSLEPAAWIPILKTGKVIFAGDHCQLAPTVKSQEAAKAGLSTTLMEKVIAKHSQAVALLAEQYRMHATIMGYSSASFYDSQLKAHASVANHLLFADDTPLSYVDTAGCGFDEQLEGTSTVNPEEAAFLFKHLSQFVDTLTTHYNKQDFPSIAIISPYKQQVELLKEQLRNSAHLQAFGDKINVNTIDSFQGQERDIVYISMTRSNNDQSIGFLSDIRRMNVAMTRARKKLVVIGDSATLSQLPFYEGFIAYAENNEAYKSAWEFMDN